MRSIDERKQALAARIRETRIGCGFSQRQVADWLGLPSRKAVARMELGLRGVTAIELQDLCRLFNCHPSYLMEGFSSAELGLTEYRRVHDAIRVLGDEDREQVYALARSLMNLRRRELERKLRSHSRSRELPLDNAT